MSLALILESKVQAFCFNDLSLFGLFVKDGVRQRFVLVEQSDIAGGILADSQLGLAQGVGWAFGLDLVDDLLKLDSQVLGEGANFLPGQDLCQMIMLAE